jgi:hypothetical protein
MFWRYASFSGCWKMVLEPHHRNMSGTAGVCSRRNGEPMKPSRFSFLFLADLSGVFTSQPLYRMDRWHWLLLTRPGPTNVQPVRPVQGPKFRGSHISVAVINQLFLSILHGRSSGRCRLPIPCTSTRLPQPFGRRVVTRAACCWTLLATICSSRSLDRTRTRIVWCNRARPSLGSWQACGSSAIIQRGYPA